MTATSQGLPARDLRRSVHTRSALHPSTADRSNGRGAATSTDARSGISLRALPEMGRLSSWPVVWTHVLTALVLSGASIGLWPILWLLFGSTLMFVGGVLLNDAWDADQDRQSRPDRVIPSGRMRASTAIIYGIGSLGLGLEAFAAARLAAGLGASHWPWLASGLLLAALIVLYNLRLKATIIGPLVLGVCHVMIYLITSQVMTDAISPPVWTAAGLMLSYLAGSAWLVRYEGFERWSSAWPVLFLLAPLLFCLFNAVPTPLLYPPVVLLAAVLMWTLFLVRRGRPPDVPRASSVMVAGICLVDALLIAHLSHAPFELLALTGFLLVLLLQRRFRGMI